MGARRGVRHVLQGAAGGDGRLRVVPGQRAGRGRRAGQLPEHLRRPLGGPVAGEQLARQAIQAGDEACVPGERRGRRQVGVRRPRVQLGRRLLARQLPQPLPCRVGPGLLGQHVEEADPGGGFGHGPRQGPEGHAPPAGTRQAQPLQPFRGLGEGVGGERGAIGGQHQLERGREEVDRQAQQPGAQPSSGRDEQAPAVVCRAGPLPGVAQAVRQGRFEDLHVLGELRREPGGLEHG